MRWSRTITAPDHTGAQVTWHLLDTWADRAGTPRLTLLCVHGNPTWSFMWRTLLDAAPDDIRVIAVDQLDMGYSQRTSTLRRLADRVEDLSRLTEHMNITGPVITVAHDWGGPISLGWALSHRSQLAGIVLLNTAVHQPPTSHAPSLIRLARAPGILPFNTKATPIFIKATTALSRRRGMTAPIADQYCAPYASAARRQAVQDFVADIPMEDSHPSMQPLHAIAEGIRQLNDIPALLLWGPDDPVFSDIYLHDLEARLPHADVHRYHGASHLVIEDAPTLVEDLLAWIAALPQHRNDVTAEAIDATTTHWPPINATGTDAEATSAQFTGDQSTLLHQVRHMAAVDQPCLITMGRSGNGQVVSWRTLADRVARIACGVQRRGVGAGDRVSVLIPPGPELVSVIYALWSIGAVAVIADKGLGVQGMRRAIRSAAPDHVIGSRQGLLLARTCGIQGAYISVSDLAGMREQSGEDLPNVPDAAEAVVVFTSGATGPAKGVVYTHRQVGATMALLSQHYALTAADTLVAAFAPWAILGPGIGVASVIPDMDVTAPGTLRADALADAISAGNGTVVWAAPAALRNVEATSHRLTAAQRAALAGVRLMLSAGAPVPIGLLDDMAALFAHASIRTPYGMTEALPIAEADLTQIHAAGQGNGVYVGHALPGVEIMIAALNPDGSSALELSSAADLTGEIVVRAAHLRDRYDRLWATTLQASRNPGWHRTGDVGHLDAAGALRIEGRLAHVVTTSAGPLTPVGLEQAAIAAGAQQAAVVGVGPRGTQQVILIVTDPGRGHLVDAQEREHYRRACSYPFAAVLRTDAFPVDIRHNSKVDRIALAHWADGILAGSRR